MLEIGDKIITTDGRIGIITAINRPKCKCKGEGTYSIEIDGVINKVPLSTKLEKYESIGLISTNLSSHTMQWN
jgi:preprotein translocase subunit YajC